MTPKPHVACNSRVCRTPARSLTLAGCAGCRTAPRGIARYITGLAPGPRAGLRAPTSAIPAASTVHQRSNRAITPKTHVPIKRREQLPVNGGINVDEHINKPTHVRPPALQIPGSSLRTPRNAATDVDARRSNAAPAGNDCPRRLARHVVASGCRSTVASPRSARAARSTWKAIHQYPGLRPNSNARLATAVAPQSCSSQSQAGQSTPARARGRRCERVITALTMRVVIDEACVPTCASPYG